MTTTSWLNVGTWPSVSSSKSQTSEWAIRSACRSSRDTIVLRSARALRSSSSGRGPSARMSSATRRTSGSSRGGLPSKETGSQACPNAAARPQRPRWSTAGRRRGCRGRSRAEPAPPRPPPAHRGGPRGPRSRPRCPRDRSMSRCAVSAIEPGADPASYQAQDQAQPVRVLQGHHRRLLLGRRLGVVGRRDRRGRRLQPEDGIARAPPTRRWRPGDAASGCPASRSRRSLAAARSRSGPGARRPRPSTCSLKYEAASRSTAAHSSSQASSRQHLVAVPGATTRSTALPLVDSPRSRPTLVEPHPPPAGG